MPYCTHCDQEYPEGTNECPVCQQPLETGQPTWQPYDPTKPLIEVATAQGELPAALIKGRLEDQGIPALIQHESVGTVWGLTIDGLGAQHILVPEDLAAAAREILETLPEIEAESDPDEEIQ
jgi:hypothetical protein